MDKVACGHADEAAFRRVGAVDRALRETAVEAEAAWVLLDMGAFGAAVRNAHQESLELARRLADRAGSA